MPDSTTPSMAPRSKLSGFGVEPLVLSKKKYKVPLEAFQIADSKEHCRYRTAHAIRRGLLTRPDRCDRCQKQRKKLATHHTDYTKPLLVRWLCRRCHTIEDKTRRMDYAPEFVAKTKEEKRRFIFPLSMNILDRKNRNFLLDYYHRKGEKRVTFADIMRMLMYKEIKEISEHLAPHS